MEGKVTSTRGRGLSAPGFFSPKWSDGRCYSLSACWRTDLRWAVCARCNHHTPSWYSRIGRSKPAHL